MDIVLYLAFGFVDVIAILAVIFRFFRFPIRMFIREFVIIGAVLTLSSFVVRKVLNLSEIDLGIQFILYVLFFRYFIKIKIFDSFLLASIGYLSFSVIQLLIYNSLLFVGVVTDLDVQSTSNIGTYVIQVVTQVVSFLFAWILYRKNLGFSFILCPPVDVHIKVKIKGINLIIYLGILASIATLFLTPYLLFNHLSWIPILILGLIIMLCLLYYATNRKDIADVW
ncbi:hypothetical protein ABE137_07355 [Brevibacillus laterosporus]|uniref:hypothetical protein n=1 Tax=Brevibacillus laterosporus TaxID=1465 RepID=UPI003D1B9C91